MRRVTSFISVLSLFMVPLVGPHRRLLSARTTRACLLASTWQLLNHSLCGSVIICECTRCAAIFCRGPRGSGMEARPQGRGERGGVRGRANHPLMGNTLFSIVWIVLSTTVGGEVAGVQEGTGIQKQSMVLKHGAEPCHNSWLLWRGKQETYKTNPCVAGKLRHKDKSSGIAQCIVSTFESPGFFIRRWATGRKTHNGGEKQVWWLSVGVRSQCYCQYIFNKKEENPFFPDVGGKIQTCSCKCNSTAVFVKDGNRSLTLSQDPNTRIERVKFQKKKSSCFESCWQSP